MFKDVVKEDLRLIISELKINEKMVVFDLNQLIKASEKYKQDQSSVNELIPQSIVVKRKRINKWS